jgi:ribosome-binding factor A
MSRRTERLGSLLQEELASYIQRDLTDPRITGFPSVTRVKVSEDLSVADVYLTVMGSEGQQSAALNAIRHAGGMMRSKLTKALSIRQVPFLKFHIDEQLKKELEIMSLISKVNEEKDEMEQRAAKQAVVEAEQAAKDAEKLARRQAAEDADAASRVREFTDEDDFNDEPEAPKDPKPA